MAENKKMLANFALLLTAFLWGISFVAQKAGMQYMGPFSFNCVRSFLGGLSLIPVIYIAKLIKEDKRTPKLKQLQHILLAKAGISCGAALFAAMSIQQYSMLSASAGKAGFISSLYIIFVPIISMFFGHKLSKNVKISLILAVIGLYLLCFKSNTAGFDFYDVLLLISAFFYGVQILVVNYFSKRLNAVKVCCLQFFVVGILSIPLVLFFETLHFQDIMACKVPLFFAGILTCGVAYTLQIFGQKYTTPVIAVLILCLESVFAVLGGAVVLHETMTSKEISGCIFMITAVILSQLHWNTFKKAIQQPSQQEEVQTEDFARL